MTRNFRGTRAAAESPAVIAFPLHTIYTRHCGPNGCHSERREKHKMHTRRLLFLSPVLVLGLFAASPDKSITVTFNMSTGPAQTKGTDCLGWGNQTGDTISATFSTALKPVAHNGSSVSYRLKPGAVNASINGATGASTFTNTTPWRMVVYFGDPQVLQIDGRDPSGASITVLAYLAPKSYKHTVVKHAEEFSPTSQSLTANNISPEQESGMSYTDRKACGSDKGVAMAISGTIGN
jgi:hypothetical protein